jgi:copper chaperone
VEYDLSVAGMTCGHCVAAVTEELQKLPAVDDVSITLGGDEPSRVVVVAKQELDRDAVARAVAEAGYSVVG